MRFRIVPFLLVLFFSTVVIADVIDVNIAPIPDIDGWQGLNSANGRMEGQQFSPTLPYLTAVEWFGLPNSHSWNTMPDGSVITAQIWNTSGGLPNAKLAEVSRTKPLSDTNWQGRFDLDNPIDVSDYIGGSATLAVMFITVYDPSGGDLTTGFMNNTYADGACLVSYDFGANWVVDFSKDMTIRTYGALGPEKAHTPEPNDLETHVDLDTDLDWKPGVGIDVVTHNIYFDPCETDVTDRLVTPVVVTEPDSNCMPPIVLDTTTTYYWAVDEVNATGVTYTGDLWQFTTESGNAHHPIPQDQETDVGQNINLQWSAGGHAVTHMVYFDPCQADVVSRIVTPIILTEPDNTTSPPVSLKMETTYYWAVDEVDSFAQTHTGNLWQFTTKQRPTPTLAGDLNLDSIVNWKDVPIFANQWADETGNWDSTNADLDGVNGVNGSDFAIFANNFFETDIPLGFKVMGTIVPPEYDNPSLHGFTEQFPPTNTGVPRWFPNEEARGYVAYVKNYMDYIYPRTRPDRLEFIEYMSPNLSAFSAPGQYEPVTFTIYALDGNNLTDGSVSVSDLTAPAGNKIRSRNIDVRLVRCWPRRVWGEPAYTMSPWLLEKRDTFDIPADTSQRYWLTVYVPDNTPPGTYNGTVTVDIASHDNSAFSLEFEVLDIELMQPPTQNAMYYHYRDLLDQPSHGHHSDEYLYKELVNMREHGMTSVWITEALFGGYVDGSDNVIYDLDPIAYLVETSLELGFDPLIWNMTSDPFLPAYGGPHSIIGKNFQGFMNSYLARGWGMPIASHGDESDANGTLSAVLDWLSQSKQYAPAMKTYTTIVYPSNSELYEPYLDIRAFSSWMNNSAVAPTRAAGRELWMYSGPAEWGVKANRVYRGFFGWALTLDGMNDWVYFYIDNRDLPFDDLASTYGGPNHRGWVLPGLGGPLAIPEWEAIREGIEDRKYTFTLEELIAQANASGDTGLIALASSAQSYLDSLYAQIDTGPAAIFPCNNAANQLSVDFCDNARLGMADHIKAISDALALLP